MSVQQYFIYKGVKYTQGTKALVKDKWSNTVRATYLGGADWQGISCYSRAGGTPDEYIIKIIEPVYYVEPEPVQGEKSSIFTRTGSGSAQHNDDVFHGLLLYIAVMLGGIIFKDRWLIWIAATIIFFGWKAKK